MFFGEQYSTPPPNQKLWICFLDDGQEDTNNMHSTCNQ